VVAATQQPTVRAQPIDDFHEPSPSSRDSKNKRAQPRVKLRSISACLACGHAIERKTRLSEILISAAVVGF
jgi:hypothetical protein